MTVLTNHMSRQCWPMSHEQDSIDQSHVTTLLTNHMHHAHDNIDQSHVTWLYWPITCHMTILTNHMSHDCIDKSHFSIQKGLDVAPKTKSESAEIKANVMKYFKEIADVLAYVNRQMILIFKTNDLLRGIESSLGTKNSMSSFIQVWQINIKIKDLSTNLSLRCPEHVSK